MYDQGIHIVATESLAPSCGGSFEKLIITFSTTVFCWEVVGLHPCMSFGRVLPLFTLRVSGGRIIVNMLYFCEGLIISLYTLKKEGKSAVTSRDSPDVNKEALAKVCKCHTI